MAAFVLVVIGMCSAEAQQITKIDLLPLKNFRVPEFKAENEPIGRIFQRLDAEVNKLRAERGLKPIRISVDRGSMHHQPRRSLHVQNLDLYTLLEYLAVGSGMDWTIRNGAINVFTNQNLLTRFQKAEGMVGRKFLRLTVIPEIEFQGETLTDAYRRLHRAAQAKGLRNLEDGGLLNFTLGYETRPEEDFIITGKFLNTNVDTILEIITQQAEKVDWTIKDGNIELVLERSLRLKNQNNAPFGGGGGAVDAFADPFADPGGAPSRRNAVPPTPRIGRDRVDFEPAKFNTESYGTLKDNPFLSPLNEALSTFSIDVDTASYSNVRRFLLEQGVMPPVDAVRIEELVNYFNYDYSPPPVVENPERADVPVEHPFATHMEIADCPWNKAHRLVKIGLQGYEVPIEDRPPSNLVFLLDVSGSMSSENKLPLLKQAMKLLVRGLYDRDRVAIVVYAGASGVVLDSTPGSNDKKILQALDQLKAGGSTNAGEGIQLAYRIAKENYLEDGNNRVILCTDGDFNVGNTDKGSLTEIVANHAAQGTQITILGFGMGNYKGDMLETISNAGDGNYGYIDNMREARKLFVERLQGTLLMIAKDVKIQVEFNPRHVNAYRLIGYENRLLNAEDFANDEIDAGDIGAGHSVTAFYEIVPTGVALPKQPGGIELKYQDAKLADGEAAERELLTLKLRYKWPKQDQSRLIEVPAIDTGLTFENATRDFRFASAVAGFGMLLRNSPHSGTFTYDEAGKITKANMGNDPFGNRSEFLDLLNKLTW